MGMFDDLIPQANRAPATGGMFDDLIPAKPAQNDPPGLQEAASGGGERQSSTSDKSQRLAEAAPREQATIVPKGGSPRNVTQEESEALGPFYTGQILPFRSNEDTGEVRFAVPHLLNDAIDAAALPGEVLSGKADPNDPETQRRATNLALLVSGAKPLSSGVRSARSALPALRAAPKKVASPAPTTEELGAMARLAYQRAEESGLQVTGGSFGRLAKGIVFKLQKEGLDQDIHPKVSAATRRLIQSADQPKTLQEIDTLRRVIKAAAASNDPDERRLAAIMVDRVDDWLNKLSPKDVRSGDANVAAGSIREARSLWSRMRKSEILDDIFKQAEDAAGANYSQAGLETAVRQRFRSLLSNKKQIRAFTKEEQGAIRRVVRGGPIENVARLVGKMAPRGVISGGFNIGIGATLGPAAGLTSTVLGEVARRSATRATLRNASRASEVVRRGGQ